MSIDIIYNNFEKELFTKFKSAKNNIYIISPFLGLDTIKKLIVILKNKNIQIKLITRFYRNDFINNFSSLTGLELLLDAGVEIMALIGLHSKQYLVDNNFALISSANFTNGGLIENYELGIIIEDEKKLNQKNLEYFINLWTQMEKFNEINNNKAIISKKIIQVEKKYILSKINMFDNNKSDKKYGAIIYNKDNITLSEIYDVFWDDFIKFCSKKRDNIFSIEHNKSKNWSNLHFGCKDYYLSLTCSKRYKKITIGFYLSNNKEIYNNLKQNILVFTTILGETPQFTENGLKASRISIEKNNIDITNSTSEWNEYYNWYYSNACNFKRIYDSLNI